MPDFIRPFVLVTLIIFAVGIGTVLVRQVATLKTQTAMNAPQTVATTSQTVQPADSTAGWKTYRNDKYGFEVRYPTKTAILDWVVQSDPSGSIFIGDPEYNQEGITIWIGSGSFLLGNSVSDIQKSAQKVEKIVINNQEWTFLSLFDPGHGGYSKAAYITKNGTTYYFVSSSDAQFSAPRLDALVPTFKFTN